MVPLQEGWQAADQAEEYRMDQELQSAPVRSRALHQGTDYRMVQETKLLIFQIRGVRIQIA